MQNSKNDKWPRNKSKWKQVNRVKCFGSREQKNKYYMYVNVTFLMHILQCEIIFKFTFLHSYCAKQFNNKDAHAIVMLLCGAYFYILVFSKTFPSSYQSYAWENESKPQKPCVNSHINTLKCVLWWRVDSEHPVWQVSLVADDIQHVVNTWAATRQTETKNC